MRSRLIRGTLIYTLVVRIRMKQLMWLVRLFLTDILKEPNCCFQFFVATLFPHKKYLIAFFFFILCFFAADLLQGK